MAEAVVIAQDGPEWRAGLIRKHRLLRGLAGHPAVSARAARFAARARGGEAQGSLAELARVAVWQMDPDWDRDRLAEIAGLLAARPVLLRTVAGPLLRELADRYTPALLEAVLEAELPIEISDSGAGSLAPADFRRTGQALLAAPEDGAARAIVDAALLLYPAHGRAPQ
jgi:hypothetical protein